MLLLLLLEQSLYLHFALGVLRESDLEIVMEELRGVAEKWESIGREVFTSAVNHYPTDIHTSHSTSHECMREVLRKRLHDRLSATWGHIIIALRKAGEPHFADNLKAKYIPGEFTTTTSSQYSLESQHEECILLYCD